jgi:hypothetical protein
MDRSHRRERMFVAGRDSPMKLTDSLKGRETRIAESRTT